VQSVDALFDDGVPLVSWVASAHIVSFRVLSRSATRFSVEPPPRSFATWCYAGEGHAASLWPNMTQVSVPALRGDHLGDQKIGLVS
jgi:hypothetical protein